MRSFAGILLATSVGRESILLIDEPEAFLHPPQARLIGRMLVTERRAERQLFIATHSSDVIRGILDVDRGDVKVLRLRREGKVNVVRQLDNSRIKELWSDPLLRYSNILDGLVHEHVVVSEGDGDSRFYSAMFDALLEQRGENARRPDVMFTHAGGKARLATVVRSLREVEVPVTAIADFDLLNEGSILRPLAESLGGDWTALEPLWRAVKSGVDSKKADLSIDELKKEFAKVLDGVGSPSLPESAREKLLEVLRHSSPWAIATLVGTAYVPPGQASESCAKLIDALRKLGLLIVEVGELESFARTVGNHGPRWVNAVLTRDLANDSELSQARSFVQAILDRVDRSGLAT